MPLSFLTVVRGKAKRIGKTTASRFRDLGKE
jgi:hypothetical protein